MGSLREEMEASWALLQAFLADEGVTVWFKLREAWKQSFHLPGFQGLHRTH